MKDSHRIRAWSLLALGASAAVPLAVACQPPDNNPPPAVAGMGSAGYPYPGTQPASPPGMPPQPGYPPPAGSPTAAQPPTYPPPAAANGQPGYPPAATP